MSSLKQTFGRAIQDKRKELGLSQKELASRIKREDAEDSVLLRFVDNVGIHWHH
jgi:ribosome-binding protein aMBF1 (putative translation factor)